MMHPGQAEPFAEGLRTLIAAAKGDEGALPRLVAESRLAVVVTDSHRHILLASPAAEFLFGYEEKGLVGRLSDVLVPERLRQPDQAPTQLQELADPLRIEMPGLLRGGREETVEFLLGTVRWRKALVYVTAMRGRGEVERAQQALRESEDRLRRLVDSLKDAVILLDGEGRVLTWNPGAQRLLGYRIEEVLGRHAELFSTPEETRLGHATALLEKARRQGFAETEAWRVCKDGTRFWANIVITALYDADGRVSGFAKVTHDLTEQKRAEAERLQLAQAREAVRLRDEFLSVASHELRTPLSALLLQLQTLARRKEAPDQRNGIQVDRAIRSAQRLATLIEMLLETSRISAGQLTLSMEQVELGELAREIVEQFTAAASASANTLSLEVDAPVALACDRTRVEQIIMNLISNALRYAPGTPVRVRVGRSETDAIIEVADGGPGVAPKDRRRIFERFTQAEPARGGGGLGLGLYVTAEIIKAHGGEISVAPAPGGGAAFSVRLPIAGLGTAQRPTG